MIVGANFHPVRTLDLIDHATVFMGVPPYYYSFLKRDEFAQRAKRWHQLRLATCGSAPIRAEVLLELESILGRLRLAVKRTVVGGPDRGVADAAARVARADPATRAEHEAEA